MIFEKSEPIRLCTHPIVLMKVHSLEQQKENNAKKV